MSELVKEGFQEEGMRGRLIEGEKKDSAGRLLSGRLAAYLPKLRSQREV